MDCKDINTDSLKRLADELVVVRTSVSRIEAAIAGDKFLGSKGLVSRLESVEADHLRLCADVSSLKTLKFKAIFIWGLIIAMPSIFLTITSILDNVSKPSDTKIIQKLNGE